jgi:putative ABC transport system permease protein
VVRQGLRLAVAGLAIGAVASLGATHVLRGLLFGIDPLDLPAFIIASAALAAAATLAAWLPARRAARADPVAAMRAE